MVLRCYVLLAVLHNEIKNETKRMFAVEMIIIGTTGSPSSLVTVNMTLRNGVIIRVCMGNTSIVRNSSK